MGRTNGKLVLFLKKGLMYKKYKNLKYEENGAVFYIDLPRYQKNMKSDYSIILKDWYRMNPHLKYKTYSDAKGVLKSAMKKSVYVLSLPSHEKRLRFRFATKEESAEKRRLQKEKSQMNDDPSYVESPGYNAESDDSDTGLNQAFLNQQLCFSEKLNLDSHAELHKENCPANLDNEWDSILEDANADSSLTLSDEFLNIFGDTSMDQALNLELNDSAVSPHSQEFAVPEVSGIPKSWVCNSKVCFGSVVQYIFQPKSILPDEFVSNPNQAICILQVDIPQTSPSISVELHLCADWLADGKITLQKHDFISGTSTDEIYLILYFI